MADDSKLFVGNLPYSANSDDLRQLFSQFGSIVDAVVLMDKFSGRSRGFGFVTYENGSQASAAVQALNGQDFQGRKLVVSVARPQEKRDR